MPREYRGRWRRGRGLERHRDAAIDGGRGGANPPAHRYVSRYGTNAMRASTEAARIAGPNDVFPAYQLPYGPSELLSSYWKLWSDWLPGTR